MGANYRDFLESKGQFGADHGFDPAFMPNFLFDFQANLTSWALKRGRAAIFADCGMGKTPMQLVWAQNVVQKTNKPVLILTPLAVSHQTEREAHKFSIEASRSSGEITGPSIYITNYERLHHFNRDDFGGVVCDESSILKSFDGVTRATITEFMRTIPYRLLCTATAAPNDYIELGTSSEALGYLGFSDMLTRFFKNDQNTSDTRRKWAAQSGGTPKWRFKGHAEDPFWRWVCSWARALRKPSDFGFDDDGFVLPRLTESQHIVNARRLRDGMLFALPAVGLWEQREERRRTINERCEKAAEIANAEAGPVVCWCALNDEGDNLERLIPDAVQVSGKDTDDEKEEKLLAFTNGTARVLVTKPVIGAWGLNWQHCAHITFFASHSFEQYYQAVRRCWRFGQTREVSVDLVLSDGEISVMENLRRKSTQADRMFSALVVHMNGAMNVDRSAHFDKQEEVPAWLL